MAKKSRVVGDELVLTAKAIRRGEKLERTLTKLTVIQEAGSPAEAFLKTVQKGLAQLRKEDVSTDHERAEKKSALAEKAEPVGRKAQRMPAPRKSPHPRRRSRTLHPPRNRAHRQPKVEPRRSRDRSSHRVAPQDAEWCVSLLLRADRPRFHAVRALAGGEAIDAGFVHVEAVAAVAGAVDGILILVAAGHAPRLRGAFLHQDPQDRSCRSGFAFRTRFSFRTDGSDWTDGACQSCGADRPDRARRADRSDLSDAALRSGRSHRAHGSGKADWSRRTDRTGRSGRAGFTARTGKPLRSLRTLVAGETLRSLRAGGSGRPVGAGRTDWADRTRLTI